MYKAALFHPLLYKLNLDIGRGKESPQSVSFMTGLFKMKPPPRAGKMPSWDLSDLLYYLKKGPFEPLNEAPFHLLTQKTLALLLLATGRRISEISALSRTFTESASMVVLHWLPDFRAKNHDADFQPDPPAFNSLDPSLDQSLCPHRAWKIYLRRREDIINSANGDRLWPMSKGALSASFRTLVKQSRRFVEKSDKVVCGPHQMRIGLLI